MGCNRFYIVEPMLKSEKGHQWFYCSKLQKELTDRGVNVQILAHKQCSLPHTISALDNCTDDIFNGKIYKLPFKIIKLISQLNGYLFDPKLLSAGDVIFIHSPHAFDLLAFCLFVRLHRSKLKNVRIIINFGFSYVKSSKIVSTILKLLHLASIRLIRKTNYSLFVDSTGLEEEFEQLLCTTVTVASIPIHPLPPNSKKQSHKKPVVAFLGGARFNKGFDILVDFLWFNVEILKKFDFRIQVDHHAQTRQEQVITNNSLKELTQLSMEQPSIKLVYKTLSTQEYYDLLYSSDIVMLPYRSESFKSTPSNIFFETIVAGKIPLVFDNTSMAEVLKANNLHCLVVPNEQRLYSRLHLIQAYKKEIKLLLKLLKQDIIKQHNVKTLANQLLEE